MTTVETVRGRINSDQLGTTLMHEHIFILTPEIKDNFGDEWWDEDVRVSDAVQKLNALKASGVDTIVDLTVLGLGRFIPRIQRVNEMADINILVATGAYISGELPSFFHGRGPGTFLGGSDYLAEMFISDIRRGIGNTGIKAAVLKGVIERSGLTQDQTRVQLAICEAHSETGVPITVYTDSEAQTGRLAISFYRDHGVDLSKVIIAHAGDSNDLDYLKWIMDAGATIGCDRFGLDMIRTSAERVLTIAALCRDGYADRIVLSQDAACFMDNLADPYSRSELERLAPEWHYLHIQEHVVPLLIEQGVTRQQVMQMMVENPKRYFFESAHA
ncbi:MAG: phosphotriesterase [Leucobacter sp.]